MIDVGPLTGQGSVREIDVVAEAIDRACRHTGFFLVSGHGVDLRRLDELDAAARTFFALPEATKAEVAMARGGRAWRGWFAEGGELTSGRPDHKEGLYFGADLAAEDPRVRAGLPLHGPNLFPAAVPALGPAVTAWMGEMSRLGHTLLRGVAVALGLHEQWFDDHLTADPTVLFRIFRYPARPVGDPGWGVAEHTDYGLLTILAHDGTPGLAVRGADGWIEVPATAETFVVNIGDMLDRMTGGRYRSTPHRVRHVVDADPVATASASGGAGAHRDRLSFPFFFDPAWDAEVAPIPLGDAAPTDDAECRWDGTSVHRWSGTYGEYLTAKVGKVFPALDAAEPDLRR
ncbi:isopenicillin N synthase family oxygenase [soil metagenome]